MSKICIVTISRAKAPAEETLLRDSFSLLAKLNLPVFVTDGGSAPAFSDWLKTLPGFTVLPPAVGVWAQARSSLLAAAQSTADFLFYTEPDKKEFFENALPDFIQRLQPNDRTGVVLASRSADAFATFPPFQQMTETTINRCCAELTGLPTDYCYGPFLLNKKLAAHVVQVTEDIGWGWRPFVFNAARRLGYLVTAEEGNFFCPPAQRNDDAAERLYRMKQLEQNIRGLVLSETVVPTERRD